MPQQLKIISYLSPNLFWFYEAVGEYLSRTFHIPVQVLQSWANPLSDLQHVDLDIAFVCGLPLIQVCHIVPDRLQAIAAPVMRSERYQNRPIYFSDLIVNISSSITCFEQLEGKQFCFNDLGSNSGYNLIRYRLMQAQCPVPFFGSVMQSGSHQQSIQWVLEQKADCAAIDSVVLEQELWRLQEQKSPAFSQLRVIESLGPSPMPPVVASQRLGAFLDPLQQALLHPDAQLQLQMQRAGIGRFATVQTSDYGGIYQIYIQTYRSEYAVIR